MSSLNFVCSTVFSLFMQEKPHSQTAVLLLIVNIIWSNTVTTLILSTLWQTNSLYASIIGLCLEFFPEIIAIVSLTLRKYFQTMKVRTCTQDNRSARMLKMYRILLIFSLFFYAFFIWITERNYHTKIIYKKGKLIMYD